MAPNTSMLRAGIIERVRDHVREPLFGGSYQLLLGLIVTSVAGFAFWLIAARTAPVASVGRASAATSAVALISVLSSFGLPYGALRFFGQHDGVRRVVRFALIWSAFTSAIAAAIFIVGARWWAPDISFMVTGTRDALLFVAMCIGVGLVALLDNLLAARRAAGYVLLRSAVTSAARLAAVAALSTSGSIALYLAGAAPILIVSLITVGSLWAYARAHAAPTWDAPGHTRPFFDYCLRQYPSALLAGAPLFALPLLVLAIVGPRETAYFVVAWSLISVMLVLPTIISNIALAEGVRDEPFAVAARGRRLALLISGPVVVALLCLASPILSLFGEQYAAHAAGTLRMLALALVPWAVMMLDLSALRAHGRHAEVTWAMLLFAGATLSLSAVLGLAGGLLGIACGWTAGVLVAAVWLRTRVPAGGALSRPAEA